MSSESVAISVADSPPELTPEKQRRLDEATMLLLKWLDGQQDATSSETTTVDEQANVKGHK